MVAVTIRLETRAVWQVWMFKFIDVKISTPMHTSIFARSSKWFTSQNAIKCKFFGKCARFQWQWTYASYFISKNTESISVIFDRHTRLVGRRTTVVASECMYIVHTYVLCFVAMLSMFLDIFEHHIVMFDISREIITMAIWC